MKKTLLFGMMLFAGLTANAQLPSGTQAPDFTATDINGNTHTLSEYLDQGKTVILDISASWCGPCWNFHSSHALSDLYYTYGPGGSNEVVVLFVEGDAGTSLNSIYGTNTPSDNPNLITQGNWTLNTPYPIIDSGTVADLYNTGYFPTLYRICPDGILTEIDPASAGALISGINTGCGQMEGPQNHGIIKPQDVRMCAETGNLLAKIKNYGNNAITTASVVIKEDGNVIATQEFTGNITLGNESEIEFDGVTFNPESDYTVEITDVNSATPLTWWLAERNFDVAASNAISNNIVVRVHTDKYPSEMSFKIKSSDGTTVFTSPAYAPGTQTSYGPDANTIKSHFITLPDGVDCYTVELHDSFGDGWTWGGTFHGLEIATSEGQALVIPGDFFEDVLVVESAFSTTGTLGTVNHETESFAIYPNPSNGVFTFSTVETVNITVSDITGKTVYTGGNIENGTSIDLTNLASGVYIAKVTGSTTEKVEKLVIK